MTAANLRQLIETGLADDTHATLEAMRDAFGTFLELADDLEEEHLVARIKGVIHALDDVEVAMEGGSGAPTGTVRS